MRISDPWGLPTAYGHEAEWVPTVGGAVGSLPLQPTVGPQVRGQGHSEPFTSQVSCLWGRTVTPCSLSWEGCALPPPLGPLPSPGILPPEWRWCTAAPSMATASHIASPGALST